MAFYGVLKSHKKSAKTKIMIIVYVYFNLVLFYTIHSTVIMWGNKYRGEGRKEQLVFVHLNWTQKGRQFFKESVVHLKRRKVERDTKLLEGKSWHSQRSKRKERLRYCRKNCLDKKTCAG